MKSRANRRPDVTNKSVTENQFVFSGLWNKRYILYNPSKASEIKEFGDYPNYWEGEKDFPENAKAMFHQSRFIKHPSKPYFASCSSFVLEIYEYDSTGINLPQLVFKKQLGNSNLPRMHFFYL